MLQGSDHKIQVFIGQVERHIVNLDDHIASRDLTTASPIPPLRTEEDFVYIRESEDIRPNETCWFAMMALAQLCQATDSPEARKTLTGITAVEVDVEELPPFARTLGLTEASIQTDVELKLRLAGMRVINSSSMPFLYVSVVLTSDAHAASVLVEIYQYVTLVRDPTITTLAPTWSSGVLISNPSAQGIRSAVKDKVDELLNAWLSVNPPKQSPAQNLASLPASSTS